MKVRTTEPDECTRCHTTGVRLVEGEELGGWFCTPCCLEIYPEPPDSWKESNQ